MTKLEIGRKLEIGAADDPRFGKIWKNIHFEAEILSFKMHIFPDFSDSGVICLRADF